VLACAIASFASFGAFIPDHARSVGLAGAGGLFAVYSGVSLVIRIFGARIPEMIGLRTSATIALASLAVGLALLAAVPSAWALWLAAGITGAGMALNYPPLWARVVDSVEPHERTAAVSSFTMFFEVGNIVGGLSLGIVAELAGKRSGFAGGVVMALIGLVVVWTMLPERNPAHAEAPTMPSAPIR
jgi:MFS family permease